MLTFYVIIKLSFFEESFRAEFTWMSLEFLVHNLDVRVVRTILCENFSTVTGVASFLPQMFQTFVSSK